MIEPMGQTCPVVWLMGGGGTGGRAPGIHPLFWGVVNVFSMEAPKVWLGVSGSVSSVWLSGPPRNSVSHLLSSSV